MNGGTDEAIALGKRLVPHGFAVLTVQVPRRAWVWRGYLHAFVRTLGIFIPIARAVRAPSTWAAGPATEALVDLAARAVDEFTPMDLDACALEQFTTFDLADA